MKAALALLSACLLGACAAPAPRSLEAELERSCHAAQNVERPEALAGVSAKLSISLRSRIVAIGSSSTDGQGASTPEHSYPAQLQRLLGARWPGTRIEVINQGVRGQDLPELRARLARDVYSRDPDLVILQTGTADAIHHRDPARFRAELRATLTDLDAHGVSVLLVDSQFYPGPGESREYAAFQQVMREVAAERGVTLVHRFGLMQRLIGGGRRFDELLSDDLVHPNDAMYACTARVLAEAIAGPQTGSAQTTPAQTSGDGQR